MWLLILIYTNFAIDTIPQDNIRKCLIEAKTSIGKEMKEYLRGHAIPLDLEIPKVAASFCVQGYIDG